MNLVEFATKEEAGLLAAEVDAEMGFPSVGEGICQAVHVGAGRHATHPTCCTLRYAPVLTRPDGKSFGYPVTDGNRAKVEAEEPSKLEMNIADWYPVPVTEEK